MLFRSCCLFLHIGHHRRYEIISTVVLVCISLLISNLEHIFICLLAICISSLEKCLFKSFSHCVSQLRLPQQNRLHGLNHRNVFPYDAGAWKFDIRVPSWSIRFFLWLIGSLHIGVHLLTPYQINILQIFSTIL